MVVSNIFYFHPYLGKISNLTNIFQMGWNHQLDYSLIKCSIESSSFEKSETFSNTHVLLYSWRCNLKKFFIDVSFSLKLTAKAPENGWLEYDPFLLGSRPIFRCYVSFRECICFETWQQRTPTNPPILVSKLPIFLLVFAKCETSLPCHRVESFCNSNRVAKLYSNSGYKYKYNY